jgi:hypothetical protein
MRQRWIGACVVGETIEMAGVALACAASARLAGAERQRDPRRRRVGEPLPRAAQALVLHRPGAASAAGIAATVVIATVGYGGSLPAWAGGAPADAPGPPIATLLGGAAALGAAMGAMMGAAQSLAAGRVVPLGDRVRRTAAG